MEESLEDMAIRIAEKFIAKVDNGMALSTETYEDMKTLRDRARKELNRKESEY